MLRLEWHKLYLISQRMENWEAGSQINFLIQLGSVQISSVAQLCPTLSWTATSRASLSITNSWSFFQLISIELVMSSNHLILCCNHLFCLQSFPISGSFPVSQFFTSGGQSIGVSATALVFPMNIQDWFPLGLTGWIALHSKRYSRVFSTTVQNHQFFGAHLSLWSNSLIYTKPLDKP